MTNDTNFLQQLYNTAFGMYRYVHSDVWRGQKYYTTLNLAIVSIGFGFIATLLKLEPLPKVSFLTTIPIFFVGLVVSYSAYRSMEVLRYNFLQAVWFKTVIEEALKDELGKVLIDAKIPKNCERWRLTPVFSLSDKDQQQALSCKELWMKLNIHRKGGITYYFMLFQIIFFCINVIGIALGFYFFIFST
jgi:hypothetical protein